MTTSVSPIAAAVEFFGTQQKLAEAIGCTQAAVSKWVRGHQMLVENAIAIERATGGRVTAQSLRPDVFEPQAVAA